MVIIKNKFQGYSYNSQAVSTQPTADGSAPQAPQPSGTSENGAQPPLATVSPSNVPPHSGIDPYALYAAQYAAAVVGTGDAALDAAQRWNAMNCSYFNSLNRATPTTTSATTEISPLKSATLKPESSASNITSTSQLFEASCGETKWSPELKYVFFTLNI